jgi:hypothetical protein
MATGKARGGKKLTQLARKRRKPAAPRSKVRAPRPRDYRKESGAAVLYDEIKRAPLRKLSQLRRESGAAVSVQELRDFLRRKPKGK